MVFDLMFSLDATEEQLDFPTIYGSAKEGWMSTDWEKPTDNILPLLDAIIEHIPGPETIEGDAQMLVTSLDFSSYVGRIAIGRVHRGEIREGMDIALIKADGSISKQRIKRASYLRRHGPQESILREIGRHMRSRGHRRV